MAYFDNAATTFPKPDCVYEQMDRFYRSAGGSVGRGNYGIALSARELLNDTRNRMANLLSCPAKQIIFEPTATISLNIILQGLINAGAKTFYISPFEHNAVTRTLYHFEKQGKISVKQLFVTPKLQYDLYINQRIIAGNAQFTGIAAGRGVGFTTGLLLLREGLGMRETPIRPHSWH